MFAVQVSLIHDDLPNFDINPIGLQKAEDGKHFFSTDGKILTRHTEMRWRKARLPTMHKSKETRSLRV
jgi:hypothetical protein